MIQSPSSSQESIRRKRKHDEIEPPVFASSDLWGSSKPNPKKQKRFSLTNWLTQQRASLSQWLPSIWPFQLRPSNLLALQPSIAPRTTTIEIEPKKTLLERVVWAHGGSLATLIGAHFTNNRMYSYGDLQRFTIEHGFIPLAGTYDGGSLVCGVNQTGISGVTAQTGYRLSDAWRFALGCQPVISINVLEQQFLRSLQEARNQRVRLVLPEDLIGKIARQFAQIKALNPQFIIDLFQPTRKIIRFRIRQISRAISNTLSVYQNRLQRLYALLGKNEILLQFKQSVIDRFSIFTVEEHDHLVGKNKYGFSPTAKQLLIDTIYLELRKLKLIYTKKKKEIIEKITYAADHHHSFGGWSVSSLATGISSLEDVEFESQFIATLIGYIIHHGTPELKQALKIPESFQFTSTMYHYETMSQQLLALNQSFQKQKCFIETCLALEANIRQYSLEERGLMTRAIPVLYCASQIHPNMRHVRYECLWESRDGVPLGDDAGVNILLTDTPENQQIIQQYLEDSNIDGVSVGIYQSLRL